MKKSQKFTFWCPVEISKAKNEKGEDIMRLGGIASTMDKDADGEFLDPSGFDISDFKKSGVVNWHHQAKNSPATIIGEPYKSEIRPDGFYVETDLYPSSELAQEVFVLAQTLKKDSATRRLGYSIEGTVIERDELNPKIVKKAKITGLAITHMPKNPKTFADIIKGYVDQEDEEEKSLDTSSAAPLKRESVDGYKVKQMTSEATYDKIFDTFPGISIEKAEKVFEFLNKINIAMAQGKKIETQDLEKAMAHLGLGDLETNPFLEKAAANGGDEKLVKDMTPEQIADAVEKKNFGGKESSKKKKKDDESGETAEHEAGETEGEEAEENKSKKVIKKAIEPSADTDAIIKAIGEVGKEQTGNVRALAQLVKAQMDTMEVLKSTLGRTRKDLSETKEQLTKALSDIAAIGKQPEQRKSLTKAVDRNFEGGDNNHLEKAGSVSRTPVLNVTQHRKQILNVLDGATFNKGFDEEFSKAVTSFEAGAPLTQNVIARLKMEHGIQIEQ